MNVETTNTISPSLAEQTASNDYVDIVVREEGRGCPHRCGFCYKC